MAALKTRTHRGTGQKKSKYRVNHSHEQQTPTSGLGSGLDPEAPRVGQRVGYPFAVSIYLHALGNIDNSVKSAQFKFKESMGWNGEHAHEYNLFRAFLLPLMQKCLSIKFTATQQEEPMQRIGEAVPLDPRILLHALTWSIISDSKKISSTVRGLRSITKGPCIGEASALEREEKESHTQDGKDNEEVEYITICDSSESEDEDPLSSFKSHSRDADERRSQHMGQNLRTKRSSIKLGPVLPPVERPVHTKEEIVKEDPIEIVQLDIKPSKPLLSFLQSCTPTMECWFDPLVAFGCDSMSFLRTLASWDEDAVKSALREVANQPGLQRLTQMHILVLTRNLKEADLGPP
ncbi:hypothetical protein M413DRAFT_26615 [Hebeloma cylindrosporum]|uniref:Uncharacterized protein n=1 Tax=Hebeloma cylindrosporum TaxID=76867 RepID=A0A0C3CEE2_HEBCY|nr:hypothetical protein M413DRAFT_26615 [Hebeloma cylindrosporum h7]